MKRSPLRWTSLLFVAAILGSVAVAGEPLSVTVDEVGSYQLYLPPLKPQSTAPLVIWLHPAGGEGHELILKWWPALKKQGYALMLPKSVDPKSWRTNEDKSLLAYIHHAVKHHRIDTKKVVLLGFSAGGQMAFYMGMQHAERLAGIVTMSAVPIKTMRDLSTPLPDPKFKDSLAYLMILGERENEMAHRISKRAQMEFLANGFSAVVRVVEKGGHEFHDSEKGRVMTWLQEVAQGKRPAAEEVAELAKNAAEEIKQYRAEQERLRKQHEERVAVPSKVADDIKNNLGKPYTLEWKAGQEANQGTPLKIAVPEGWQVREPRESGDSSAVELSPPDKQHIVAFLGRTVKEEGVMDHYGKWFRNMQRKNRIVQAQSAPLEINGHRWHLMTYFMVPLDKAHQPESRRTLILALLPLNKKGTEWRSLTVMCPEQDVDDFKVAEVARGILEKSQFGKPVVVQP